MAIIIQIRRGTAAQWAAANPILADGEVGLEKDTLKEKIGDGVTEWNSLTYRTLGATFPIITISGRPWELRKTVNLNDPAKAATLEANDIIVGSPAAGEFMMLRYNGGDNTDFDNNYTIISGI